MPIAAPAVLASVASPRRREILRLVWQSELSAGDVHRAMPEISFGAVSLQLRALAGAGLVAVRPDGRMRYYRARREALGPLADLLERMWDDALWRLTREAELEQARRGPRPGHRRRRTRPSNRRRMS